jgi:hypothetical protein
MLADLAQDLRRQDADLLVARDVGQVRDVLQRAEVPDIAVGVHPTVDAAVHAALRGTDDNPGPAPATDPDTGTSSVRTAPDTDRDGPAGTSAR